MKVNTNLILLRILLQPIRCNPKGATSVQIRESGFVFTGLPLWFLRKYMSTQNFQTKKFFLYARKSTDTEERQVRSIDDQIAELQELAKKENIEVIKTFIEKQTAKEPGRPIFNEMLSRIEKCEAEGILA